MENFLHMLSAEGIEDIVRWGGLLVLVAIVFIETGLLIGFFLPGDSLLVVAGFMAATTGLLQMETLVPSLCIAAIAGDSVGYALGSRWGASLYAREQSRWFRRDLLVKTRTFYDRHGGQAIALARFVPFARTFAPVVAGIAGMDYARFFRYNVLGGLFWVVSLTLVGYFFGQLPWVREHIDKGVLVIIALSLVPIAFHSLRGDHEGGEVVRQKHGE